MSETVEALLCDLLEWVGKHERPYTEVLDAWRTSCPRLPIWEEATERGYVHQHRENRDLMIGLTDSGREFLARRH